MTKAQKNTIIWAEMARRKLQFHNNTNWNEICLWGLFRWGFVSHLIKSGELITGMKKENKTIWVRPSTEAYHKNIEPLLALYTLDELTVMAGWE